MMNKPVLKIERVIRRAFSQGGEADSYPTILTTSTSHCALTKAKHLKKGERTMKKLLILILLLLLLFTFIVPVSAGPGGSGNPQNPGTPGKGICPGGGDPPCQAPGDAGPGGKIIATIAKKGSGDSGNNGAWSNSPQGDDPGPPGWAGA
jgi:hypothetical protein